MENTWVDHSRHERLCCGEGRSSFGDRKRAYLRSALKTSRRLFPAPEAGMAQRRVTSSAKRCRADALQPCLDFPPSEMPVRIADQSAVRAGAGREPARVEWSEEWK